jgi:glycosyltransferase involved in cell wall biosynthesis
MNALLKILDAPLIAAIANYTSNIYYSPFYGKVQTKIPQIFTVHDMIYEKFPKYFPITNPVNSIFINEKKGCFERASLLLANSLNTARDLLGYYPHISPDRVKVVYLGVDDIFFSTGPTSSKIERPYFLYVGNRSLYKNFSALLLAFGKSGLAREFDLHIVSPAGSGYTEAEQAVIAQYRLIDHIKLETAISDQHLRDKYKNARAFVYPSEYEGFGFPVLEALAAGTIVLTSNVSSMPEIGGEAPVYFYPHSMDSLINALLSAGQMTETERALRIETGRKRAGQFTWQASQASFIAAIRTIL